MVLYMPLWSFEKIETSYWRLARETPFAYNSASDDLKKDPEIKAIVARTGREL